MYIRFTLLLATVVMNFLSIFPASAAKLLLNPREVNVQKLINGQSTTRVISNDVNVRNFPTKTGNGGFVFAVLSRDDQVYVISCKGFHEGSYWVHIYIPQLKEFGYVAAEFLQNNYNHVCDR